MGHPVPTVTRFSIAPVRSLGLLHPAEIDLTEVGVVEDRRFYLVDEMGRFIDRTVIGELCQIFAWTDPDATRLQLTFPDGEVIDGPVELGDEVHTPIYGRSAIGHEVTGPWAGRLTSFAGRSLRLIRCDRPGETRDGDPTSIVSEASVAELARQAGLERIDARRFRMLIEVDGVAPHEEDTWIGRRIGLGSAILRVTEQDARCAITTQDPDTGARDLPTLRTIIDYRGMREGHYVDFGVLADVMRPGRIRLGDSVRLLVADQSGDTPRPTLGSAG